MKALSVSLQFNTYIKHHVGHRLIYVVSAGNVRYPTKFNSGRFKQFEDRSFVSSLSLKQICILVVNKANGSVSLFLSHNFLSNLPHIQWYTFVVFFYLKASQFIKYISLSVLDVHRIDVIKINIIIIDINKNTSILEIKQ